MSTDPIELKMQNFEQKIDFLVNLVQERLTSLSKIVEEGNKHIVKVLDDHEARLRAQAVTDSTQGQEIAKLQVQIATLSGDLQTSMAKMDGDFKELRQTLAHNEESAKKTWQDVALTLLKYLILGGGAAGTALGLNRLLGF